MGKLNRRQRAFAKGVADGLPPVAAAKVAGYDNGNPASLAVQACRLSYNPEVQALARLEREKALCGYATLALSTMAKIIADEDQPAAARVSASKWMCEAAGMGLEAQKLLHRIGEGDERAVSQLSAADLEALVLAATDKVRFERSAAIDAEVLE